MRRRGNSAGGSRPEARWKGKLGRSAMARDVLLMLRRRATAVVVGLGRRWVRVLRAVMYILVGVVGG